MNTTRMDNLKAFLILLFIVAAAGMIGSVPWWGFVVPVLLTGIIITLAGWKVLSFPIGFLSGFIIWLGAVCYFHFTFNGFILTRFSPIARAGVLLASGLTGGILTGLALYTGRLMVFITRK